MPMLPGARSGQGFSSDTRLRLGIVTTLLGDGTTGPEATKIPSPISAVYDPTTGATYAISGCQVGNGVGGRGAKGLEGDCMRR